MMWERLIVEPDLPHKVHPTVKLDFVTFFFLALMVGCLFATGGEKMTVWRPGKLPFLSSLFYVTC